MIGKLIEQAGKRGPPSELNFREPLKVVVEKYGDGRTRVRGDLSKEALRELLMSSLMLAPGVERTEIKDSLMSNESDAGLKTQELKTGIEVKQSSEFEIRKGGEIERSNLSFVTRKYFETKTEDEESIRRSRYEISSKLKITDETKLKLGIRKAGDKDTDDSSKKAEEILKSLSEKHDKNEDKSLLLDDFTSDSKLSQDGKWLQRNMKEPLKMALKEIVAKKPYDPVSYLGFWLLHYRNCQERETRQRELGRELTHLRSLMKEPATEIKQEEFVPEDVTEQEEENSGDWNFQNYDPL